MKSIFSPEGVLFNIAEKIGNLMILNFIYIICCLPIFTIGPATIAMHSVALKLATDEEEGILMPFLRSFRLNFKQGLVIGLLLTGMGIFLAFDLYYIYQLMMTGGVIDMVVFVIVLAACLVYVIGSIYVYPMLAKFDNTTKQTFKTAALLAIRHLPATICMLVIGAAPVIMLLYTPTTMAIALMLYLLLGFAAVAMLQDKFMIRIFRQYIPREEPTEEDTLAEAE